MVPTSDSPAPDLPRGIGAPATRALVAAGYTRLDQLADVPAEELAALHGVGPKALRVLREALAERGLVADGRPTGCTNGVPEN
ncbi:DNA-binding protein [Streptomyces sp. NPDC003327]